MLIVVIVLAVITIAALTRYVLSRAPSNVSSHAEPNSHAAPVDPVTPQRRGASARPSTVAPLPAEFVVVDIETTGFDPNKDQIIEIGALKMTRDSGAPAPFQTLVKANGRLPERITEITGITSQMLERDGQSIDSAMAEYLKFVGDLPLVFFNAPFDVNFLSQAASRCGYKTRNRVSCALSMSRRAWPGQPSYTLANLARVRGISIVGSHRALKDCELTVAIYTEAVAVLNSVS